MFPFFPCPTVRTPRSRQHPCRLWLLVPIALLASACSDAPDPMAPVEAPDLSRGQVEAATSPNPFIDFLPPLGPEIEREGMVDPDLEPRVIIYLGTGLPCAEEDPGPSCASEVARFTTDGSGPGTVRVGSDGIYLVNWSLGGRADLTETYRITVWADGILLDYLLVSGVRGTVPIRFRILEGATGVGMAPIGPEGGSVSTPTGSAGVEIPEGSLTTEEPVTVETVDLDPATDGRVIEGTKHFFGPTGTTFEEPVTITLRYDPSLLPEGTAPALLRLHRFDGQGWSLIPGSSVDPSAGLVSGQVSSFSLYSVLPVGFNSVATGESHACGLTEEGVAWCWGNNEHGQLGTTASDQCDGASCSLHPLEVDGGHVFADLTAGRGFTCGRTPAGEVLCWGVNSRGELGDGSQADRETPLPVSGLPPVSALATGLSHTCAAGVDGSVYCWGLNAQGGLGVPSADSGSCVLGPCETTPISVPGLSGIVSVSTGIWASCALSSGGDAWCWGGNSVGELTDAAPLNTVDVPPTALPGGSWQQISMGALNACAVDQAGAAWCWGGGALPPFGTLGNGTLENSPTPVAVAGGHAFSQVEVSPGNEIRSFACGVTVTGDALCWGANAFGSLGVESAPELCAEGQFLEIDCASAPLAVAGGVSFSNIAPNRGFTCALEPGGDVYCWGRNDLGQLGDGSTVQRSMPGSVVFSP
jgi:alpha-tubulin suppressor-like RCC1 family protein